MTLRQHKWIFWGAVVVLVLSHLNFHHGPEGSLWWGWLPRDMAYHLIWMVAATATVVYMTLYLWPNDNE